MRNVHRVGDVNAGGGAILVTPARKTFVEGPLVAVTGSMGSGHGKPPHSAFAWISVGTNSKIMVEGIPIVAMSDPDTCGHPRVGGARKTFVR